MLEGLYQVEWSKLTHAYGNAGDVPGIILLLASPIQADRDLGYELLDQRLVRFGAIYEAAAYIVPYLLQLLEDPLSEDKPRLIDFLANLASGSAPLDVLSSNGGVDLGDVDPQIMLHLARERSWAVLARWQVQEGLPIYLRALNDKNPAIRAAVPYLLSQIPEAQEQTGPQLLERLKVEDHVRVIASVLFALPSVLENQREVLLRILESYSRPNRPSLSRLAALIGLARIMRERSPDEVRIELVDVLSSLDPRLADSYASLPWAVGHLYADLSMVLCCFGPEQSRSILPDLIRVLNIVDSQSSAAVLYAILHLGFGNDRPEDQPFSGLQRAALAAIASSDVLWATPVETSGLLRYFDLPDQPEKILAYLS